MIFTALPKRPNARKRILRNARTGARPVRQPIAYENAFGTLQAVQRYAEAFTNEQVNVEFFSVLQQAWTTRHDG